MKSVKTFLMFLMAGGLAALGFSFIALCLSRHAHADEQPDFKCETYNVANDYACMRENWRPKKQVSYEKADPYCDRDGQRLHGKGEIDIFVDDEMYTFKIDCP